MKPACPPPRPTRTRGQPPEKLLKITLETTKHAKKTKNPWLNSIATIGRSASPCLRVYARRQALRAGRTGSPDVARRAGAQPLAPVRAFRRFSSHISRNFATFVVYQTRFWTGPVQNRNRYRRGVIQPHRLRNRMGSKDTFSGVRVKTQKSATGANRA